MPKPCSLELRERVVDAVESGASRREAADWFEVSPSSAIKWMQRRQATTRLTASTDMKELCSVKRQAGQILFA